MTKKSGVAVITDTVSPHFYFPLWHKYYSSQFGASNLYVVTYAGMKQNFHDFSLGGLWESDQYNNAQRIRLICKLLATLLERYEFVIHVDTDEFLVADPRSYTSLSTYMGELKRSYVTAEGIDIIQKPDEGPLNLDQGILSVQRRTGYFYDALNKTCVTNMELIWAPGFHFCSVFPDFNNLFLLHLKRADVDIQIAIGQAISSTADGEPNKPYYLTTKEQLMSYNKGVAAFPSGEGWAFFDREDYRNAFLRGVHFTANYGGVYHGGGFRPDKALVTLPMEFSGIL